MRPRVIGIMGGVASGKSMVAEMLGSLGAEVIHADEMAHELLEKPEIKEKVLERWGKGLLGVKGEIDRGKLASIVFSNGEALKELTNLLHPPILESIRRLVLERSEGEMDRKGKGSIPLVLDAALLLETGLDEACDLLVFVEASPEVKEERSRLKGWSSGEVQRREGFQSPESQKKKRAHVVINNDSSKEETFRQVKDFWQKLVL
ncbi:MAG TPA: dephospho-CoA kinase [Candidatus Tripitaka californicus]|uniref:dephospho-CoA kinase n=1 Tax=Candidatus Tripitaka californicus TaxID=3367616 RepID=UPI004025A4DF|nr:dephospho-CoA kinase [Planctomycetota bacterium]